MPPAIIAGGIAAAGAIGGAVIGSKAQSKAAGQANASQQAATQAQLQLGRESMALNRDIYNSNYAALSPYNIRGNAAGDQINALLGIPTSPVGVPTQSPLASGASSSANNGVDGIAGYNGPSMAEISAMQHDGIPHNYQNALAAYNAAKQHAAQTPATPATTPATPAATPAAPAVTPVSAQNALNNFANSAGMQFQLQQGENALNNGYAGHGLLQSGAAMKAMQGYGQQTALNNYFMPYMGLLGGQQAVGAGAASSIAGVGTNFGNTAANISANMGNTIQNGANSASNAALANGYAKSQMWSGIGSALGGLASSFGGGGGFPSGGVGFGPGYSMSLSDRRLKTNIEKVGEASDGLGIYEWNWKTHPDGEKSRGVMADEVEKLRPWAFVANYRGEYAGVNYGTLGSLA